MRAAVVLVLLTLSAIATADDGDEKPEVHKFRFIERGPSLTITANPTPLAKLFDSAAYEALDSGFTSTVVIRIWIYPKGSNDPVAFVLLQRQVLYNLWDEVFELRIDGRAPIKEKRQSEALKKLTALDDLPVARLRVKGRGVPKQNTRGDLYVELDVRMPDQPDDALAAALRASTAAYSRPVREDMKL